MKTQLAVIVTSGAILVMLTPQPNPIDGAIQMFALWDEPLTKAQLEQLENETSCANLDPTPRVCWDLEWE